MYLMLIGGIACLVFGCLFLWAHRFVASIVKSELATQKIYFPEKESSEFDPRIYPELQKYAGQLVDNPEKTKAYANGFIGRNMKQIADGKTYAEINAESMKNLDDKKLHQQKQILFQGETLRGLLLIGGYGFGTFGKIAGRAALVGFALSCFSFITAFLIHKGVL